MNKLNGRRRRAQIILGGASVLLGSATIAAQTRDGGNMASANPTYEDQGDHGHLLLDIKDYFTAPIHWDAKDWAYFGGAVAAFAVARHYDTQVRTHFIKQGARPLGGSNDDLKDAVPALAALGGTWVYANLIDSTNGRREAWEMLEAGGLSVTSSFVLKFAAGRERPNQTDDPNKWRKSGSSFPSLHASVAFAIGSVLAESGNDDYRWLRRFLGYGAVAGFTAFERLKHNAHWLSDDVAGAALGGATAHYVMQRNYHPDRNLTSSSFSVVPLEHGAMLTYNIEIR